MVRNRDFMKLFGLRKRKRKYIIFLLYLLSQPYNEKPHGGTYFRDPAIFCFVQGKINLTNYETNITNQNVIIVI